MAKLSVGLAAVGIGGSLLSGNAAKKGAKEQQRLAEDQRAQEMSLFNQEVAQWEQFSQPSLNAQRVYLDGSKEYKESVIEDQAGFWDESGFVARTERARASKMGSRFSGAAQLDEAIAQTNLFSNFETRYLNQHNTSANLFKYPGRPDLAPSYQGQQEGLANETEARASQFSGLASGASSLIGGLNTGGGSASGSLGAGGFGSGGAYTNANVGGSFADGYFKGIN